MKLARLEPDDLWNRRYTSRRRLNLGAAGSTHSASDVDVVVHDLSVTGLLIEAPIDLSIGDRFTLELPGPGAVEAVVMWKSGQYFGCEFVRPIPNAALSAAALRSEPTPRLSDAACTSCRRSPLVRPKRAGRRTAVATRQAADPARPVPCGVGGNCSGGLANSGFGLGLHERRRPIGHWEIRRGQSDPW